MADWQTVPDDYVEVDHDGYPVRIDRAVCEDARAAARRTGRPHNIARATFVTEVIHALSLQIAERIGADPLGGDNLLEEADLAETRRELREDEDVQAALFEMWPLLTPRQVLRDRCSARRPARVGGRAGAGDAAAGLLARPGRRPTYRCWTSWPSCSARTTR